jgi:V8-like Glu-specific endopeptidase
MGMTPNGKTATNLQEVALTWYNEMSEFAWQTSPVTCPGDTGAPVLCYEYDDNGKSDYALHGVVVGGTHRQRCAPNLNSYVSFFTRIRKFDDLISKFTGCNHNKICSKRM